MTHRERLALRTVLITVLLLLAATTLLFAQQQMQELAKSFVPATDRPLQVSIRGDGAEVEIASVARGREGRARYRYTPENFEGVIEWNKGENRLSAVLDMSNLKFDSNDEDHESDLDILLPRTSEVDLDVVIKGGVVDLNGEGMQFSDLDIEMWAGELKAEFPTASRPLMRRVEIDVKMGEVNLISLGNLAFEELDVNGFAGEMNLDFSGSIQMKRTARIDLEFGALTIYVPKGLGVEARIGKWGFLAEVNVPHDWGKDGKFVYSPAVGTRGVELSLDVRGGVGEISIVER
jgi:hypothetical protein